MPTTLEVMRTIRRMVGRTTTVRVPFDYGRATPAEHRQTARINNANRKATGPWQSAPPEMAAP